MCLSDCLRVRLACQSARPVSLTARDSSAVTPTGGGIDEVDVSRLVALSAGRVTEFVVEATLEGAQICTISTYTRLMATRSRPESSQCSVES